MPIKNPYLPFLEDNPDVLYRGWLSRITGQGSPFTDYWRQQYGNVYGDFLGELGKTALGGMAPTQTFADFLKGYDFTGRWNAYSPKQRGFYQPGSIRWNI